MGLKAWIRKLVDGDMKETEVPLEEMFGKLAIDYYARNLAFASAVNLIANSIAKCEFRTFEKGREVKTGQHYLWNVQPNANQNASEFLHKLVERLYADNEVLVVQVNRELIVADGFQASDDVLLPKRFTWVTSGNMTFRQSFFMDDVLYLRLAGQGARRLVNGLYETYGELLSAATKSYQNARGERGTLKVPAMGSGDDEARKKVLKTLSDNFQTYFNSPNAIVPLYEGYEYAQSTARAGSGDTTRDIRAIVDDTFDFTARALGIPPAFLRGELANTSWAADNFLTYCIDPLADMLQKEINRKQYGRSLYERGDYIAIDTSAIKHIDLLSVATSVDKLISSGVFSINDILKVLGKPPLTGDWADEHWITKNYQPVDEAAERVSDDAQ